MKDKELQDLFLAQAKKLFVPVTLNLTNGFQVKGVVTGFDSFTVVIDCEERQTLVYKHAIATIIPTKPIKLNLPAEQEQD